MIKFFRKIRQKLLTENKFSKYLIYAIGEIILVVIGILIALQINNWNENSKLKQQTKTYEKILISELETDLIQLNFSDSLTRIRREEIHNYFSFFKNPNKDSNTLVQKMRTIQYYGSDYKSVAYTIDDIISSGKLSQFDEEIKKGILELKAFQEYYAKNRVEVEQKRVLSEVEFENSVNLLSVFDDPTTVENKNLKNWRFNTASEPYRLFNNKLLANLLTYNFRADEINKIRAKTEKLLNLLKKDKK